MNSRRNLGIAAVLSLATLQGCYLFDSGGGSFPMPSLGMKSATLVQNPSADQLVAYYCPQLFSSILCQPVVGASPLKDDLKFFFELRFDAGNTGDLPVPLLEMLLGLNVFPGIQQESLGSTCVRFCPEDDASCDGSPGPNSCKTDDQEVNSVEDFAQAIGGFVFAAATGQTNIEDNLKIRVIPPGTNIDLSVVFGLDPDTILDLVIHLAEDAGNKLVQGKEVTFDIPYAAEGTLFFDVPILGRQPLGFGPFEDTWSIAP
jgi:hypothetical protein